MIEFDAATHTYTVNGRILPSVTQILRESGLVDPSIYPPDAAERGTAVHLACQLHDEHDLDETTLDPILVPYLAAWKLFLERERFRPESIEQRIVNLTYGYAGTLDRRGTIGSPADRVLIDIKTGEPHATAALQTAAYAEAIGEPAIRRVVVQLLDDGTYRLHEYRDPSDRRVFLSAVAVVNWRRLHITKGKP